MKIIDAHSHIDYISHNFQEDVVGTICCATNESDWDKLIDIMQNDKNVYSAFGIHPWFVDSVKNGFEERLETLLKTNRNFMVGETGLDKYKPDMDKQINIFQSQLNIAIHLHRSVFLHCVGAWEKILCVLKQYKQKELPIIVVHDFNANNDILDKLLQYKNIYFSLGKNFVYDRLCRIEEIPSDKILIESDADKNVILTNIIDKISSVKKEPDIADMIYNNTIKVINNG